MGPATWDGPPRTIRLRYRWGVVDGWCRTSFRYINTYLVHRFGLTDRVLARVPGRSTHHAGHNTLLPYALDLLKKRSIHTGHLYREAFVYMPRGVRHIWPTDGLDAWSPEWLKVNRREIDVLEAQNRNDHRFLPNLALAMTRVSFDPASTHSGRQPLNRPPVQSDEAEGDAEMGDPGGISTAVPVEPWSAPMVMDE